MSSFSPENRQQIVSDAVQKVVDEELEISRPQRFAGSDLTRYEPLTDTLHIVLSSARIIRQQVLDARVSLGFTHAETVREINISEASKHLRPAVDLSKIQLPEERLNQLVENNNEQHKKLRLIERYFPGILEQAQTRHQEVLDDLKTQFPDADSDWLTRFPYETSLDDMLFHEWLHTLSKEEKDKVFEKLADIAWEQTSTEGSP